MPACPWRAPVNRDEDGRHVVSWRRATVRDPCLTSGPFEVKGLPTKYLIYQEVYAIAKSAGSEGGANHSP